MSENTSLAVSQTIRSMTMPTLPTVDEIQSLEAICAIAAQSNFVNSSAPLNNQVQRKADAFFVVMMGRELGIPAMQALKTIYVVNGKPCCSGQALLSLMRRAGVELIIPDPATITDHATIKVKRPNGEWHEYTYTQKMATDAGLWGKDMWKKYSREMLIWRCVSTINKFETPDIGGGLYTIEELAPDSELNADGDVIGQLRLEPVVAKPQPEPQPIITVEIPAAAQTEPTPAPHDPNKWYNGNVIAWIANYESQGVTKEVLKAALKLTKGWDEWQGTVSEATEAVEAYRKPKTLPPEVAAAQAEKPAEPATPEKSRVAELNNEELLITRIAANPETKGWYGFGMFDGVEVRVNLFAPEDTKMIKDAGYEWTGKNGAVHYPVILKVLRNQVRIASIEPKQGANPYAGTPKTDPLFTAIPGMSDAAKHQLADEPA